MKLTKQETKRDLVRSDCLLTHEERVFVLENCPPGAEHNVSAPNRDLEALSAWANENCGILS